MAKVLESVLICPHCGSQATEAMPKDACLYYYRCRTCSEALRPLQGDCCVFCSYGTVKCPPQQVEARVHGDPQRW